MRRRDREQRESRDHAAVDDVRVRATRGVRTLGRQHPPVVPVEGGVQRGIGIRGVAQRRQPGAGRTRVLVSDRLPIETVLLVRLAREPLRVRLDAVVVTILGGVLDLGVRVGDADADRLELVLPDAPREQLVAAGGRVEAPHRVTQDERNRERVRRPTDEHQHAAVLLLFERELRRRGTGQFGALRTHDRVLAVLDDVVVAGSRDRLHGHVVVRFDRGEEGLRGRFRRLKTLTERGARRGTHVGVGRHGGSDGHYGRNRVVGRGVRDGTPGDQSERDDEPRCDATRSGRAKSGGSTTKHGDSPRAMNGKRMDGERMDGEQAHEA